MSALSGLLGDYMLSRRHFAITGTAFAAVVVARHASGYAAGNSFDELANTLAVLERESGGRLGVAVLDTKTGRNAAYRDTELFPLASTFKLLAAAAVLSLVDAGKTNLDTRVVFQESELVTYSPATKSHVGGNGMSLSELCEAAITLSDNTAGNMLLRALGGPAGLTSYARTIGDLTTRLDRIETELNEATPGDVRDTTSPRAMLANLHRLAIGDALKPASREQLVAWLKANKTGNERMRAKLPPGWIVGDKTGLGNHGTINDVGIIWPPDGAPILLAIYLTNSDKPIAQRAAILQEIGRLTAAVAR
jgi:beta-lactamase class A